MDGARPDRAADRPEGAGAVLRRAYFRRPRQASALRLGVVLAAGGEFAFVVFKMARDQGLFQNDLHNLLVLSITLSMAPDPVAGTRPRAPAGEGAGGDEAAAEMERIDNDDTRAVVIAGVSRMGQIVARVLRAQRVPFIALDTSVETIELTRTLGAIPDLLRRPDAPGDPSRGPGRRPSSSSSPPMTRRPTSDGQARAQAVSAPEDHRPRA